MRDIVSDQLDTDLRLDEKMRHAMAALRIGRRGRLRAPWTPSFPGCFLYRPHRVGKFRRWWPRFLAFLALLREQAP